MKFLIFFCLIISTTVFPFTPPNPCNGYYNCSEAQIKIWEKFEKAIAPKLNLIPSVYSGSCYHLSQFDNPNHEHFGVVMLDQHLGNLFNYGQYGFYYEENPYRNLTVQDFRNAEGFSYSPSNKLLWEEDGAMADYSTSPENIWRYYFRQDRESDQLFVIGFWTQSHILFCELNIH